MSKYDIDIDINRNINKEDETMTETSPWMRDCYLEGGTAMYCKYGYQEMYTPKPFTRVVVRAMSFAEMELYKDGKTITCINEYDVIYFMDNRYRQFCYADLGWARGQSYDVLGFFEVSDLEITKTEGKYMIPRGYVDRDDMIQAVATITIPEYTLPRYSKANTTLLAMVLSGQDKWFDAQRDLVERGILEDNDMTFIVCHDARYWTLPESNPVIDQMLQDKVEAEEMREERFKSFMENGIAGKILDAIAMRERRDEKSPMDKLLESMSKESNLLMEGGEEDEDI